MTLEAKIKKLEKLLEQKSDEIASMVTRYADLQLRR